MQQGSRAKRLTGIGLVLLSSVFFGLTGIFTKEISADSWTIAGWRGLVGGVLAAVYVLVRNSRRKAEGNTAQSFRLGWRGLAVVAVSAIAGTLYIASFKHTYVANVAIIYAAIPFAAAGFDRLIGGQPFTRDTMIAAAVSMAGVAIMVAGGLGAGHLLGDAIAFGMMLLCALYLALVRAFTGIDAVWAAALSALVLFPLAFILASPLSISMRDLAITAVFGVVLAAAMTLWTEGARLIPAAESGLLGSAEIPVAIGAAWLILSERPPLATVAGGAIVLAAVFTHAARNLLDARRTASA